MAILKNILFISLIYSFILLVCTQESKRAIGKTCTSSRIECAFNVTKDPIVYFSGLSGVKPYNKICRYDGRLYQLGWTIQIKDDPCTRCECNEHWDDRNPTDSLSCSQIDCEPELQIKLKAGCLPQYSPSNCCPIDYYCRQQCVYNGTRYAIGTELYLREAIGNTCDVCRCTAPPHFTCEQRICTKTISERIIELKEKH